MLRSNQECYSPPTSSQTSSFLVNKTDPRVIPGWDHVGTSVFCKCDKHVQRSVVMWFLAETPTPYPNMHWSWWVWAPEVGWGVEGGQRQSCTLGDTRHAYACPCRTAPKAQRPKGAVPRCITPVEGTTVCQSRLESGSFSSLTASPQWRNSLPSRNETRTANCCVAPG